MLRNFDTLHVNQEINRQSIFSRCNSTFVFRPERIDPIDQGTKAMVICTFDIKPPNRTSQQTVKKRVKDIKISAFGRNTIAVFICCITLVGFTVQPSVEGSTMDAAAELSGLKNTADDLIRSLEEAGLRNTQEVAISINAMLDRLEQMIGVKLTVQLKDLEGSVRAEFAATRATLDSLSQALTNLPYCTASQADIVVAGIVGGMQSTVNSFPLANGDPIAYLIEDPKKHLPYRIELEEGRSESIHVVLKGANLWTQGDTCGDIEAKAVSFDGKSEDIAIDVLSADKQKIDLAIPGTLTPGQWLVSVTGKKPRFLACSFGAKKQTVSAGILAHKSFQGNLTIDVTPVCPTVATHTEIFSGGLNNGGWNNSRERASRTLVFSQSGYKLDNFDLSITRNRRGGARATRSGNSVIVQYHAQGRGSVGQRSTGKIYWSVRMNGSKAGEDEIGQEQYLSLPKPLSAGDVSEYQLDNVETSCEVPKSWVIAARALDSEGQIISATKPLQIDKGQQGMSTNSELSVSFDAVTRRGIIEIAPALCGAI